MSFLGAIDMKIHEKTMAAIWDANDLLGKHGILRDFFQKCLSQLKI